ncbi:hypothetical protein CEXT_104171 [Caerostris extrusa]|uniref:Uncharacterized protein n=1 Tax=Caerostris extrusa TaxID=172846 RepID=A0AAV4Y822_CAEEX|nr:hypothetical protein CEXT_104171 [Caerostris extrusa]
MPLYYIQIHQSLSASEIYGLNNLLALRVSVEKYRGRPGPNHASVARAFHSSEVCRMAPKCVKCGEKHLSQNCTYPAGTLRYDAATVAETTQLTGATPKVPGNKAPAPVSNQAPTTSPKNAARQPRVLPSPVTQVNPFIILRRRYRKQTAKFSTS